MLAGSGRLVARGICGYGRLTNMSGSTNAAAFSTLLLVCTTEPRLVLSGDCVVSSHSPSSESPSSKPTVFFLPELERGRSFAAARDFLVTTAPLELCRRRAGLELFFFIDDTFGCGSSNAPSQRTWFPPRGGLAAGVAGADFLR